MTVGIDGHLAHLRLQPLECMASQWHAVIGLQAFVHAPHALPAPTAKDQAGDVSAGNIRPTDMGQRWSQ
jgi:hypothetical protein